MVTVVTHQGADDLKGVNIQINSIYNNGRRDDVWLE
jgi:hypothetical protein